MKFSIVKFSRFALILVIVLVLMPQMISQAQQDRALKVVEQTTTPKEQRIALIIGNGEYAQGSLTNAVNDAQDMATTLRAAEFEVLYGENQNRRQMRELIR